MRFSSLDGISGGIHELSHHAGDEHRLHVAVVDRMGVRTSHFGDAENALAI